jgi:Lon protease-like protein
MFPLHTVLFPHMLLPLHVFEDRYRRLTRAVLEGDSEFGVVLIERGSEVGGDDERCSIGTVARILQADELDDGRWVMVTAGMQRLRVLDWLENDAYPQATVELLQDPEPPDSARELREDCLKAIRRMAALSAELGDPAPPLNLEFSEQVNAASYQACAAAAPIGTWDRQKLLEIDDTVSRFRQLLQMLAEHNEFLHARLAAG